jgi:uncharacterized protein involved in exopolysaccharide biosynthesis
MSFMLVLQVLRRRIWIVGLAFLATIAGAVIVLLVVPPRYDAVATASIDPSLPNDPVSGQGTGPQNILILQGNLISLAKSNQVALGVVKRLNMDANPVTQTQYRNSKESGLLEIDQYLAAQLVNNVEPRFIGGSNVMSLTYKGSDPRQAATLANAFMSSFIDAAIGLKVDAAQKASLWLSPQVEKSREDLSAARDRLARFQSEAKLLAPSGGDSENDQLIAATSELTKAKADLLALQSQLAAPALTAAGSNEAQSLDLATLGNLRTGLSAIDSEIAKLQTEVGANNPRLQEKFNVRQSLQRQLDAQVEDYRKKLKDRIATQTGKIAQLEKVRAAQLTDMIKIQAQRDQLSTLMHDVAFYQEETERMQRAANHSRLQSQLSFSNISVVDTATPPTSVAFPKPMIIGLLSVAAGLALGVLLALLTEALDRRVRTSQDLRNAVDVPLLGEMIDTKPKTASFLSRIRPRLRIGARPPRLPAKA